MIHLLIIYKKKLLQTHVANNNEEINTREKKEMNSIDTTHVRHEFVKLCL